MDYKNHLNKAGIIDRNGVYVYFKIKVGITVRKIKIIHTHFKVLKYMMVGWLDL